MKGNQHWSYRKVGVTLGHFRDSDCLEPILSLVQTCIFPSEKLLFKIRSVLFQFNFVVNSLECVLIEYSATCVKFKWKWIWSSSVCPCWVSERCYIILAFEDSGVILSEALLKIFASDMTERRNAAQELNITILLHFYKWQERLPQKNPKPTLKALAVSLKTLGVYKLKISSSDATLICQVLPILSNH